MVRNANSARPTQTSSPPSSLLPPPPPPFAMHPQKPCSCKSQDPSPTWETARSNPAPCIPGIEDGGPPNCRYGVPRPRTRWSSNQYRRKGRKRFLSPRKPKRVTLIPFHFPASRYQHSGNGGDRCPVCLVVSFDFPMTFRGPEGRRVPFGVDASVAVGYESAWINERHLGPSMEGRESRETPHQPLVNPCAEVAAGRCNAWTPHATQTSGAEAEPGSTRKDSSLLDFSFTVWLSHESEF
jgi:hypothetical protein